MFEEIIDKWYQDIVSSVTLTGKYIYLPEILSNDKIELFIKIYLTAEINWWIYQEKIIRESNKNFDFSAKEFEEVNKQFERLLFNNARFNLNNIKILISNGVKLHLNFVCRPRTTLKWFIFRNELKKSYEELSLRMKYFLGYDYLMNKLAKCEEILKMQLDNTLISAAEFERLLEKYDNEALYEMSPSEFIEILDDLFYYFDPEYHRVIPINALIIFLDDKGLYYIAQNLQSKFESDNKNSITKREFENFLNYLIQNYELPEKQEIKVPEPTVPYREVIDYNISKEIFNTSQSQIESENTIGYNKMDGEVDEIIKEKESQEVDEKFKIDESDYYPKDATANTYEQSDDVYYPFNVLEDNLNSEDIGFEDFDIDLKSGDREPEVQIEKREIEKDEHEESPAENNNGFWHLFQIENSLLTGFIVFDEKFPVNVVSEEYNFFVDKPKIIETNAPNDKLYLYSSSSPVNVETILEFKKQITPKLLNKVLKQVFNRNENEFNRFIDSVISSNSWKSAAVKIDLLFSTKSIDPDSSLAKEFRETVQSLFLKQSK